MYLDYFSLKEKPFSISPDPRFLFMSNRYREALSHLTYGGGFVLLTGEVGTGKTTVCRCLLQQLPDSTRLAFVLNPKLDSLELLATICDELKIDYPENCNSLKILTDRLSEYLLLCYEQDLNVVVMIDEAQNLQTDVLEQIRLLTNLETNQQKLLQIILVGQPELQEKLARRELRQLAQRVTARYHLRPLQLKETAAYILHRTRIAGGTKALFSRQAIEYLHEKTQGIPRLINTICDRALYAAAARRQERVGKIIMTEAVKEIMGEIKGSEQAYLVTQKPQWKQVGIVAGGALLVALIAFWIGRAGNQNVIAYEPDEKTETSQSSPAYSGKISSKDSQVDTGSLVVNQNLLDRLIGQERWDGNGRFSFSNLLTLWQIEYSPFKDGDACAFALQYGLQCFREQGNWQSLRSYNRPALLKFSAGLQGEFWGVVKELKGLDALVVFGNKETQLRLDELSTIWTGEFLILWQVPVGYDQNIKMWDTGETVEWLSQMLNMINQSNDSVTEKFDEELKTKVIAYQQQRNIKADGVAGMKTILKINQEMINGIPLLVKPE